jgi:hypothetical protein
LAVELWLSFVYGSYNGAMIVFLTEIMPVEVRTTGFSLAYSLATALFGGFTPAISTYLIHLTGNQAIPGLWLSLAAACGLIAALFALRTSSIGSVGGGMSDGASLALESASVGIDKGGEPRL